MENRINKWDFVYLRQSFETSEGIVPERTEGRVLERESYGKGKCKVLLSRPRCHAAIIPEEVLEFKSSHVPFTRLVLSSEVPLFYNIPDVCPLA